MKSKIKNVYYSDVGDHYSEYEVTHTMLHSNTQFSLSQQIGRLYDEIYKKPYPGENSDNIARKIHGITHVASAAMTVWVLLNLRRMLGDKSVEGLTQQDIFYLQIAVLFHDADREDEFEDRWDLKSATTCYHDLRTYFQLSHEQAKRFAEAIANKDIEEKKIRYELVINGNDIVWEQSPCPDNFQKPIEWQLMHDVDCLEVIRARVFYHGDKLDVYKWIQRSGNLAALDLLAIIISEYKGFIINRGDEGDNLNLTKKADYENERAYEKLIALWEQNHPALFALYNQGCFLKSAINFDDLYGLTKEEREWTQRMRKGEVLARGISIPSGKPLHNNQKYTTNAELEIRKAAKVNYSRSTSLVCGGIGSHVVTNTGFLIIQDPNCVQDISSTNLESTNGRKTKCHTMQRLSLIEIKEKTTEVCQSQKISESGKLFGTMVWKNSECLYDVNKYSFSGIFFCTEPNPTNQIFLEKEKIPTKHTDLLEAVFLQQEHQKHTAIKLPIFEYSTIGRPIKKSDLTEDILYKMWSELILNSFKERLSKYDYSFLSEDYSLIKIKSVYGKIPNGNAFFDGVESIDRYYSDKLRYKIDERIKTLIQEFNESLKTQLIEEFQNSNQKQFFYYRKRDLFLQYFDSLISPEEEKSQQYIEDMLIQLFRIYVNTLKTAEENGPFGAVQLSNLHLKQESDINNSSANFKLEILTKDLESIPFIILHFYLALLQHKHTEQAVNLRKKLISLTSDNIVSIRKKVLNGQQNPINIVKAYIFICKLAALDNNNSYVESKEILTTEIIKYISGEYDCILGNQSSKLCFNADNLAKLLNDAFDLPELDYNSILSKLIQYHSNNLNLQLKVCMEFIKFLQKNEHPKIPEQLSFLIQHLMNTIEIPRDANSALNKPLAHNSLESFIVFLKTKNTDNTAFFKRWSITAENINLFIDRLWNKESQAIVDYNPIYEDLVYQPVDLAFFMCEQNLVKFDNVVLNILLNGIDNAFRESVDSRNKKKDDAKWDQWLPRLKTLMETRGLNCTDTQKSRLFSKLENVLSFQKLYDLFYLSKQFTTYANQIGYFPSSWIDQAIKLIIPVIIYNPHLLTKYCNLLKKLNISENDKKVIDQAIIFLTNLSTASIALKQTFIEKLKITSLDKFSLDVLMDLNNIIVNMKQEAESAQNKQSLKPLPVSQNKSGTNLSKPVRKMPDQNKSKLTKASELSSSYVSNNLFSKSCIQNDTLEQLSSESTLLNPNNDLDKENNCCLPCNIF